MNGKNARLAGIALALFLLIIPLQAEAQQQAGAPPVGAPLIREGDYAVNLVKALNLSSTRDEVEAESRLGQAGITPRNGWIADYPVTPDVVSEIQQSVAAAAGAGKISMSKDQALAQLQEVNSALGLPIAPYDGRPYNVPEAANYPDPTVINNYYGNYGPPVVTYYTPPPDYYFLYAWVPSPFIFTGFWFPGFFVLHDFHRSFVVHNRVVFVSNHFNDISTHRAFRVDPRERFSGRTFRGIGAPRGRAFISTGIPNSERRVFHAPHERPVRGMRTVPPHPVPQQRIVVTPHAAPVPRAQQVPSHAAPAGAHHPMTMPGGGEPFRGGEGGGGMPHGGRR
ncbi:MAG: hypothetical protein ABFD62_13025 [Syntrophaceae bacterium]